MAHASIQAQLHGPTLAREDGVRPRLPAGGAGAKRPRAPPALQVRKGMRLMSDTKHGVAAAAGAADAAAAASTSGGSGAAAAAAPAPAAAVAVVDEAGYWAARMAKLAAQVR